MEWLSSFGIDWKWKGSLHHGCFPSGFGYFEGSFNVLAVLVWLINKDLCYVINLGNFAVVNMDSYIRIGYPKTFIAC